MRVLFWGTPIFAVPTLRALAEEGHDVVAVVTQPDRPAGRGRVLRPSDVKSAALSEAIPVLAPERPRGEAFLDSLRGFEPEVSVVVAYGHILVREVLDVPTHGSINVHASLLPELRGAAPIEWAIARGHDVTGVTVMRMVEAMDAGPILHQVEEPIGEHETASDLRARLSEIGAQALVEALALLTIGALEEREQEHGAATYAPKIDRATARVEWAADAPAVARLIRAMDESPGAWTELAGSPVKLFRPEVREAADRSGPGPAAAPPGTVLLADATDGLVIAAGEGAVCVGEVQAPGKRRMPATEWIRGRGVHEGQRFA